MIEAEVVQKTHQFLKSHSIDDQSVLRLYTDAHATLVHYKGLAPFQRFTLDFGDFVMHPDLVGKLADGESIFAIEAKGSDDLIKGLAQAEMYQAGFHFTYLAAEASSLGTSLIDFAKRKNVGIFAVDDTVTVAYMPQARMPLREPFRFIERQLDSVWQVSKGQTYQYNIPTHYLVWVILLTPRQDIDISELPQKFHSYPMPQGWKAALAGAQKLGIVKLSGQVVRLTFAGAALRDILPNNLNEWSDVHSIIGSRSSTTTLADYRPQIAAAFRLLLLQDSMVRLVISGLEEFLNGTAHFADLAQKCDQIDHARAPVFFLKPESAVNLADNRGRIVWANATGQDYRSRMFYQYKSILKHAGILTPRSLGGASTKDYDPTRDIWELR